jgi:hypothetical protein
MICSSVRRFDVHPQYMHFPIAGYRIRRLPVNARVTAIWNEVRSGELLDRGRPRDGSAPSL